MRNVTIFFKTSSPMVNKCYRSSFLACTMVVVLAFTEFGLCGETISTKPNAPFDRYAKLLNNPNATIEDWQSMVRVFLKVHEKGHRDQAPRALLFAARGALVLYQKSRKKEDCDKAVELLNTLVRRYEKSPYFIDGLKELKRAHEMRLRLLQNASHKAWLKGFQPAHSARAHLSRKPPGQTEQKTTQGGESVSEHPHKDRGAAHPQVPTSGGAFWANRMGNPYYGRPAAGLGEAQPSTIAMVRQHADVHVVRRTRAQYLGKRDQQFIVVLDPGHGGRDPGAVSPNGSMKEKDLALDLCFRIQKRLLEILPDVQVKLTRTEDTYLALVERTEIANSLDANLFISIHGNAYADSRAQGIETFYLSAANTRGAMRVAARENGISLARMNDVQATLVDLVVTGKKEESAFLANEVHNALISAMKVRGHSTRDRGVKTAPFYVLLGAKMPAILVECLFVTSLKDKKNLLAENKLNDIADGIARGTMNYIIHNRDNTGNPSLTSSVKLQGSS